MRVIPFASFVGPSYVSQSGLADAEVCRNWYVERTESPGAAVPAALYPTPGVDLFGSVTRTGGRATYTVNGRLFAVIGNGFHEVDRNGIPTLINTVLTNSQPAQMASNGTSGNQVAVASGGAVNIFALDTGVWTPNVVTSTQAITHVGMVDGFFLGLGNGILHISDSLAGLTWDPTQIAVRSAAGDPWTAMCINNRQICLWGAQSGEFWRDAGTSPFPFALAGGSNFGVGIAAIFSAAAMNGVIYWLGQTADGSRRVYRLQGYTPVAISTRAIDHALASYDSVANAEAVTYEQEGHAMYVLNIPGQGSWAYDATENLWHERQSSTYREWRVQSHAYCFDRHVVIDRYTGLIGTLSVTTGTEVDGSAIRRVRVSPPVLKNLDLIRFPLFQLFADTGIGTSTGQGVDPKLALRVSHDGGKSWSNERTRSIGKIGEYDARIRWLRCGSGMKTVFEIVGTDPVPYRVLGAYLGIGGASTAKVA